MTLRVALLHHEFESPPRPGVEQAVHDVATNLRAGGHKPVVLSSHPAPSRSVCEDGVEVLRVARLPERTLRLRGFTGPLTQIPLMLRALTRGGFELAHAFSAPDAAVALHWRRTTGRPVVFTCGEPLDRAGLADRRLRLRLLSAAIEESDAVLSATAAVGQSLRRWMAVEARVIDPGDGAEHERLYHELLRERPRQGRW